MPFDLWSWINQAETIRDELDPLAPGSEPARTMLGKLIAEMVEVSREALNKAVEEG